ncbi:MAG: transposase [Actinomycetota bacterium]|nr:transposase [Actinomycetota bacterium]
MRRQLLVRTDGAGYSKKVLSGLADRNLLFSVAASEAFSVEIRQLPREAWQPALASDSQPRRGALVAELALTPHWAPAGSRVIVRRERAHPGAQLRLWDHGGWRHQVILTNQTGAEIAAIEVRHRGHANVENRIKAAKDTGLERLPFTPFAAMPPGWKASSWVACSWRPHAGCSSKVNWLAPSRDGCATPSCTPQPASSAGRGAASCGCPTAGPGRPNCWPPTSVWGHNPTG